MKERVSLLRCIGNDDHIANHLLIKEAVSYIDVLEQKLKSLDLSLEEERKKNTSLTHTISRLTQHTKNSNYGS